MNKTFKNIFILAALVALVACKKDKKSDPAPEDPSSGSSSKKYALVIDNGAQSVDQGKTLTYSAHLVSSTGAVVAANGVSWSSNIGGLTGANFTYAKDTTGIITASIDYEGVRYTASVPVAVNPLKNVQLFAVVPSAIIWSTNSGPIQLNTIYIGNQSNSYTYSSENSAIASVSSNGNVTFNAAGNTRIKVVANIGGQTSEVVIPVMVVGEPEVPLPVTRITVSPALGELFRGENLQLVAKAFNSKGEDVTNTVTFNYQAVQKEEADVENEMPITVSATGLINAKAIGGAYVRVTANGIMGQSEIVVNPDTVILVQPYYTMLGIDPMNPLNPPKTSEVLTATTYKVDRTKYKNDQPGFLNVIPNPANLQWIIPTTGVPEIDNLFNVITLSNKTNNNVTVNAIQGKVGSTFVVALSGDNAGAASVIANP